MSEKKMTIEHITDPIYNARRRPQRERAKRNSAWLAGHWRDVLPQARGRHIAVAGEEAFIADTAEEALRLARVAHSEDDGIILQYVRQDTNPRIYAHKR
jgi:hypothetical protein